MSSVGADFLRSLWLMIKCYCAMGWKKLKRYKWAKQ
jgi:hypothetical protein